MVGENSGSWSKRGERDESLRHRGVFRSIDGKAKFRKLSESCLCLLAAAVFAAVNWFFARALSGARPARSPNPDVERFQSPTGRVYA